MPNGDYGVAAAGAPWGGLSIESKTALDLQYLQVTLQALRLRIKSSALLSLQPMLSL